MNNQESILKPDFENSFPAFISGTHAVSKEDFLKNPRKYPQLRHYVLDAEKVFGLQVVSTKGSASAELVNGAFKLDGLSVTKNESPVDVQEIVSGENQESTQDDQGVEKNLESPEG